MLRVDLHDGGGAVLVIHVGIGIGGVGSAVGVEGGGDVGEAAKELVGGGARGDAGRVCKSCILGQLFTRWSIRSFVDITGWGWWSWTWVGLTLISMFHHVAKLHSQFSQTSICPNTTEQVVE